MLRSSLERQSSSVEHSSSRQRVGHGSASTSGKQREPKLLYKSMSYTGSSLYIIGFFLQNNLFISYNGTQRIQKTNHYILLTNDIHHRIPTQNIRKFHKMSWPKSDRFCYFRTAVEDSIRKSNLARLQIRKLLPNLQNPLILFRKMEVFKTVL